MPELSTDRLSWAEAGSFPVSRPPVRHRQHPALTAARRANRGIVPHGIEPASVCFEITETSAIANLVNVTRFIQELKTLGYRFSLDDFCAGMSSFVYLKHLPVDYLKIDGSFIKDMLKDPIDRAMAQVINRIGHVMGKRTVAEFVETQEILEVLREIGIDYAQGYGLARPLPFNRSFLRETHLAAVATDTTSGR